MTLRPTVDVLVPTRGRPEALARALASVEALGDEGVVIRVHVVEDPEGRGPAWARNRAAERGSGEFLALLDDDDRWLPGRLARAVELLRKRPELVLVCGDAELASGGRFLRRRVASGGEGRDHGALALDCEVCTSTVTLRRADWEAAGGMDEGFGRAEDYELWLRLTQGGRRAHVLPEPLAWRDDDSGGLSSDLAAHAEATLAALQASARMPEGNHELARRARPTEGVRAWHDRRGRLRGVRAHALGKRGEFDAALEEALRAVREAPRARVAWTSLLRATLRLRRPT